MRVIGLTGGIGTGKSTVSGMLAELGACVLDADRVGHGIYRRGTEGFEAVVAAFGEAVVGEDGEVDRKKLGAIVFSDPDELEKLNQIVHPRMRAVMQDQLAALARDQIPCALVEAAILIEAKWTSLVDEVWVTTAPLPVIVERLLRRSNLTESQVMDRVNAQMSTEERSSYAQYVIDTDCTLPELRERVTALWSDRCQG